MALALPLDLGAELYQAVTPARDQPDGRPLRREHAGRLEMKLLKNLGMCIRSAAAGCFKEEPRSPFGFIDPHLKKTGARYVSVLFA